MIKLWTFQAIIPLCGIRFDQTIGTCQAHGVEFKAEDFTFHLFVGLEMQRAWNIVP